MTGVILAGGENRRFPFLKGFIPVGDYTIIEQSLFLMKRIFPRVIVSTNMPEVYFPFGASLVGDILKSGGPMSGIHASLVQAGGDGVFVTACDMPFVGEELVRFILGRHKEASENGEWDATIPIWRGEPQPLMGVYSSSLIRLLEEGISRDKRSLRRFLREIRTNLIPEEDVRERDAEGASFVNINTVEDYKSVMGKGLTLINTRRFSCLDSECRS
ncbi:MAG: molybdenum cofactor guanylyltransferase [Nitrospirales bacterium]|nr:molybdenum cofactor guanylyltransferase [Nitrospirales bacterium]